MEYTGIKEILKEFLDRLIKDDSTTTKNVWSASKTNSELNTKMNSSVTHLSGDVPTSRKINNKALSSDITLSASDVGAVPTSRTVNNKALSSDITISASDIGATRFPDYSRLLKHVGSTEETWTATEDCYIITGLIGSRNFDLYINGYQVRYLDNYAGNCLSTFLGYAKKGDVIRGPYWKAYGLR